MVHLTLGRLVMCILAETFRRALPILVKVTVRKCLEQGIYNEGQERL